MPAQDYPSILRHQTPKRAEQLALIVAVLETAQTEGAIANARFQEAKTIVTRAVERAWEQEVERPFIWNRDYNAGEEERKAMLAFSGSPAPHVMRSFDAKAAALGDAASGIAARAFLDEVRPLMSLLDHCKRIAVKRAPAPETAPAAETYSAPAASRTAMGQVTAALQGVTAEARDHLAGLIRDRQNAQLSRFLAAVAENLEPKSGAVRIRNFGPHEFAARVGHGRPNQALVGTLSRLTRGQYDPERKITIHRKRPDADEIMNEQAGRIADDMCAAFIERNLGKLASIIDAKANFSGLDVIGRTVNPAGMHGRLRIRFEDGASFEARTSVVWSHSVLGKAFARFPITFHDVVTPDGLQVAKRSEQEMNEIFATTPAEETPDDTPTP